MDDILQRILDVQPVLHAAGTLSPAALRALASHAAARRIRHSAETGCGATTLLLSHLSENHTVFALDVGASIAGVRDSPLLRAGAVRFVEGPSQLSLPAFRFEHRIQLALLDGPHAYPFPDLEYYYLYPHLDTGALLVIDDIHIRGIHKLFEFLRADRMFRLEQVVRTTAFFTRTEAPAFNPHGDDWEQQGYNRRTLWRCGWRTHLRAALPRFRREAANRDHRPELASIEEPASGETVSDSGIVSGCATIPANAWLWILAHRRDISGWWPQAEGPVSTVNGHWSATVKYGDPADSGKAFEIAAAVVTQKVNERWQQWVRSVNQTGSYPPVQLPSGRALLSIDRRTVRRL
ncbi:MAG TPA: class I SAM-dependent methyltransferase [Bryobacteraceae bacterium]|nr:class I SAM-dependent methyltransferase [Bryobacteraceae bacterium]